MKNLNIIIGNRQPIDTLSKNVKKWRISKGKLSAHLIFFNRISYYSGYTDKENYDIIKKRKYDSEFYEAASQTWKLEIPKDPILNDFDAGLIIPIISDQPDISTSQAILEKIEDGFNSFPGETWICHPEVLRSDIAALSRHPFAPSINVEFLDGLICPPDSTEVEEVLKFREQRSAEREAFFYALYKSCEAIEINGKKLSVNIDTKLIENALKELNQSTPKKWMNGVKRSFQFEIRPNQATAAALLAGYLSINSGSNAVSILSSVAVGAISFGVSLTPKIEIEDNFTKSIGFVLQGKRKFEK